MTPWRRGGAAERLGVWLNVLKRIRFFGKMYPLSAIAKDAVLFPLDYARGRSSVVRNLTFAVTDKCNLRCSMCYFHTELGQGRTLPLELFQKAVDGAARSRPCVILSGGEPFLHPDLVAMVRYAKSGGLPVQIFTNGTLAVPEAVDRLVAAGLDYIGFTLLGDERSHPAVAGLPASYRLLRQNLEYFAAHRGDTKVVLNYTVTPGSLEGIGHALELAERLSLDGVRFQHYNFLRPAEFQAQERRMSSAVGAAGPAVEVSDASDLRGVAQRLLAFMEALRGRGSRVPIQWAPTLSPDEILDWYSADPFTTCRTCLYPWRGILVDAAGKLYPCSKIRLELGDLRDDDILPLWNGDRMRAFRRGLKQGLFPACSRCCKL
ncbi:MAG: radical SAM protein [Elusimicrobia bacterium]|nr:radical SAM protein [Elusimicrobiota bacterium]